MEAMGMAIVERDDVARRVRPHSELAIGIEYLIESTGDRADMCTTPNPQALGVGYRSNSKRGRHSLILIERCRYLQRSM
jgi:hypothetical protein